MGATDPTSGLAKTEEETNLNQQRSFGDNFFVITQIRTDLSLLPLSRQTDAQIAASNVAFQDYANFNRIWEHAALFQGVLTIRIGAKDYQIINQPLLTNPPGFGYKYLNVPSTFLVGGSVSNRELVRQKSLGSAVYNLEPVQLVEPQRAMEIYITYPNANLAALTNSWETGTGTLETPVVNMGLIFDGYIARPNA
jgi:hypothetical protein